VHYVYTKNSRRKPEVGVKSVTVYEHSYSSPLRLLSVRRAKLAQDPCRSVQVFCAGPSLATFQLRECSKEKTDSDRVLDELSFPALVQSGV
jgi:hypothetical protein